MRIPSYIFFYLKPSVSALCLTVLAGQPALAQVLGPGFGASGYQVNALADSDLSGTSEVNTFPNSTAEAVVDFGVFNYASSQASLHLSSDIAISTCCAGFNSAGAGSASKVLYSLSGGNGSSSYNLTFHFAYTAGVLAVGDVSSIEVAAFEGGDFVGSNLDSAEQDNSFDANANGGVNPEPGNINGFSSSMFFSGVDGLQLSGGASITIPASTFVIIGDSLSVSTEMEGDGYIEGAATVEFLGVTLPSNYEGNVPILSAPGEPNIPVTVSAAPEPYSWLLLIAGLGIAGLILRRKQYIVFTNP